MLKDKEKGKITSIEGVRGLASVIVFLHHFVLLFYPAAYWSENSTLCNGGDIVVGQTPLGFFFLGNSAVMAFLIITGFGTYYMADKASEEKKTKFWILRFPKMFIMIWTSVLFIWILIKCNLIYGFDVSVLTKSPWLDGWGPSELEIAKLLTLSVFDVGNMYNGAFWTLYYIFMGSFISLLVHNLVAVKKHSLIYISIILLIFLCIKSIYFLPILLGCFLAECYLKRYEVQMKHKIGISVLILAIFFWSYPSIVREGYMYDALPGGLGEVYHMIGAFLLIMLALFWPPVRRWMECQPLQWLAKHSMAIYVLHFGILISFSSYCYQKLIAYFSHNIVVLITLVLTSLLLAGVVVCYDKIMSKVYKMLDGIVSKLILFIGQR